jgi:hypothetical protein
MQFPAVGVKFGDVVQDCAAPLPDESEQVTGIEPVMFRVPRPEPLLISTLVPEPTEQVGQEIAVPRVVGVATMGDMPVMLVPR